VPVDKMGLEDQRNFERQMPYINDDKEGKKETRQDKENVKRERERSTTPN
jgi:hypothetical protein